MLCALCACSDSDTDGTKDMTQPVIADAGSSTSPTDCETFHRGDTISFSYLFTDDTELGAFNIEVHNNFDHHTHSTSAAECQMDDKKSPVKPWVYNSDFAIPQQTAAYDAKVEIAIPGDIDAGDYHFMIRLTDKAGWQQLKGVSIKILD